MATCVNCGGPITSSDVAIKCPFCDVMNEPPPREVQVAVPVQVVNVIQAPSTVEGVREKRCPHCRKRLVTVKVEGIELDGCGACGGIWIENASARRVLASPLPVFADLARRAARGASGSRGRSAQPTCPMCPAVLDRARAHDIELDVCDEHGTWFDANELTMLVERLRGEQSEPQRAAPVDRDQGMITCPGCGSKIYSSRANVTDVGLRCDACWRKSQSALVADFDAKHANDGAIGVAGAVLGVAAIMLGAASKS